MSKWLAEKAERNQLSVARLTKALPAIFPPAVLSRAFARPFVPPTPRLAIESAAVVRLEEIYDRNTAFLRDRFEAYANGEAIVLSREPRFEEIVS